MLNSRAEHEKNCKTLAPGPQVIKLFNAQLSMKFHLLIKTKILTNEEVFFALSLSDVVFIMLTNVKMPTIVGILTIRSSIILCSAELSMKKDL